MTRAMHAARALIAVARPEAALHAVVTGPDGKARNMGRVDRRIGVGRFSCYLAPRAQWYRYVTFPRLAQQYPNGRPTA